ncbi:MAG: Formamidopyrimidine-DNA glycosylase [Candidatus Nomurabacteria bacterium GW2011_GWF2_35_66]|uniref:Formamidopyrimidine-DNA glycosylase n=1 Tax=Candidatus Nomurabacteria bacterium GW2011_GWE1_35_16 TaxID=1618761 RepID=A0A0G0BAX6_9BACT|nr:MAG: Formamidopyrimidine-DNA glycosylase [Candidatus Nomurabacteria bacterium GW2011_GWF1_34_20]KKP63296.1 MAG: Formamidopyrimidine-DNA glycosylase [Candidatus Nomurabacteria bacterium GW2011_GWE2_34_25]KKP66494.1 MAG: Formamidopyrimidine-DNA glycosylase [Candidatus Nomurabacteria bacterium GW2011_GWE1_35_16]KKP83708.1 MAG: Formamidopyrimidine-DNA glycosylase [Candidatus Nomurabacteria bacterium GW2011_GWF2_35_66]HAE36930.1 hypothetical protein [Candidatus Nomurabacteria bacterium]
MPELPEVTTTVNGLKKALKGLAFLDVWTDLSKDNPIKQFRNTIKDKKFFLKFRKEIKGARIVSVERRAKNILINLSNKKTILIHLKMTGHIIVGQYNYDKKSNKWSPDENERKALHDPYNRFIHAVFHLSNSKHMVFCDSRKFGKITMLDTNTAHSSIHLSNIGNEPLDKNFSFEKFKERLLLKPNKNIKTVLMDQSIIAGIGNIYSDEMLWISGVHPESRIQSIPKKHLVLLYKSMQEVLNKGIDFGGDSMSDYRDIDGKRGNFQNHHNVYRKNKELCGKRGCRGVIMRKVLDGRSAHFCDTHQKLFV